VAARGARQRRPVVPALAAARQSAQGQSGRRRGRGEADSGARGHRVAAASGGRDVALRGPASGPDYRQGASRAGADGGRPQEQARVAGGADGQDCGGDHAGADPAAGADQGARAYDHRGQRQGVRGARQAGRGAGPGLPRAAVPLVGAGPVRAHERLGAAVLTEVKKVQAPAAGASAAGAETTQQPAAQGAGLSGAERGVPRRVGAPPRHGTRMRASAERGDGATRKTQASRNGLLNAQKPTIRPDSRRLGLRIRYRRC